MPSDPFVILGVKEGASQSEILEAYKAKRAYYQQHVFDEGEAGADAARMLEVLDNAYQDVRAAISSKNFEKAQSLLDDMYYRGGEWHYFQAIIFYEKNWLNESKKQLELAVDLEPENEKYKRALENMKKKIDGTGAFAGNAQPQNGGQFTSDGGGQSYATQRSYQQQGQPTAADGCCTACQCAICADCCCECMGGDLIRCC